MKQIHPNLWKINETLRICPLNSYQSITLLLFFFFNLLAESPRSSSSSHLLLFPTLFVLSRLLFLKLFLLSLLQEVRNCNVDYLQTETRIRRQNPNQTDKINSNFVLMKSSTVEIRLRDSNSSAEFTPIVRIDRPMKATKRRAEMMVDTPSSPLDVISCDFSTSAADSEARVCSEVAWSLRIEFPLAEFWRSGFRTRSAGRRERMFGVDELRRRRNWWGFGLKVERKIGRDREVDMVVAMAHLLHFLSLTAKRILAVQLHEIVSSL